MEKLPLFLHKVVWNVGYSKNASACPNQFAENASSHHRSGKSVCGDNALDIMTWNISGFPKMNSAP